LSMMIIGGVAGFIGQVAQSTLGHYWKIFAGIVAIFLGLATLKLLPFSLSFIKLNEKSSKLGESESVLAGILLGGILFYMLIIKNKIIGIIMKDTKKKKGILAAIWDSMTKTGGCCGPGDSCGCSATSEKSKKTSKK
nr:hypothetical protein [Kiritimatiellia bacterium]